MRAKLNQWDYLIVTASNESQAGAYESQLKVRKDLGLLSSVREVMVVPDPAGKRIGSGGSTLYCLMEVLNQKLGRSVTIEGPDAWEKILRGLRILIVHAGGDSRRLPAYGPCGKIFVPVPSESDTAIPLSLFDRQLPVYLALPETPAGTGQVVITSGDVLLRFEPSEVTFAAEGVTGLTCYASPEQASRHGVFCRGQADRVKRYLQKPSVGEQQTKGAIDAYGQSCLDIGIMNFDAATAVKMLELFGARAGQNSKLTLSGKMGEAVVERSLDFYREMCCAMGSEASKSEHTESARNSGSKWTKPLLEKLFNAFSPVPFSMKLLRHCDFLDFGSSRAIISSGTRLLQEDRGISHLQTFLDINNEITNDGVVKGASSWVEGCRINSSLTLGGENVVVGVDARIHYVLPDILDPKANGGQSLLYYTGVTRLAKNILRQVVGGYLNRHRALTATLRQIHIVAEEVADALIRKDIVTFGRLIDVAWQLNRQLDPNSSSDEIESLFERVRPHIYGAKLLGAGGGGFMLMICKSAEDARSVREMLEAEPPNQRARFFDFDISNEGLTVTVC